MAKFGWWILLIVVSVAILAESTSTTTKKPKARKAPLQSNYPYKKRVRAPTGGSPPGTAPSSGSAQPAEPASSAVRRNPASLQSQDLGFEATRVDKSRLKEDMAALGLTLDSNDNNVNAVGPTNTGNQQRPPARAPARAPAPRPAPRPVPRPAPSYNPYSDYEDLLFDEYDQPLQDNKLLAETSSSTSSKFLKSEV